MIESIFVVSAVILYIRLRLTTGLLKLILKLELKINIIGKMWVYQVHFCLTLRGFQAWCYVISLFLVFFFIFRLVFITSNTLQLGNWFINMHKIRIRKQKIRRLCSILNHSFLTNHRLFMWIANQFQSNSGSSQQRGSNKIGTDGEI